MKQGLIRQENVIGKPGLTFFANVFR